MDIREVAEYCLSKNFLPDEFLKEYREADPEKRKSFKRRLESRMRDMAEGTIEDALHSLGEIDAEPQQAGKG